MPVFVQFTLLCDTRGCGITAEQNAELLSIEHGAFATLPEGWSEFNGTLRCPGCHDCTDATDTH